MAVNDEVHPRVCVSGISCWGWTLEEELAHSREAGIDRIGLALRKVDLADPEPSIRAVRRAGVEVANVIGVGPFRLDRPDRWPDQQQRMRDALVLADRVRAPMLVLTTGCAGSQPWELAAEAFASAIAPVRDTAAHLGVQLVLEHTNSLRPDVSFVHTLRDAVDLARGLGIGVCMEVTACWGERGLADTIVDGSDVLALVQVSDVRIGTTSTPDRLVPGDGDIPLERILGQVLAAGYPGLFDLELIGPHIEEEGYASAIGRSVRRLSELLTNLRAR